MRRSASSVGGAAALHALVNSEIPTRNTLSTSWLADATCELSSHAELGDVVVQLIERSGLSLGAVGLAEPQPVDLEDGGLVT